MGNSIFQFLPSIQGNRRLFVRSGKALGSQGTKPCRMPWFSSVIRLPTRLLNPIFWIRHQSLSSMDSRKLERLWPSKVINATGVVVHTNLGRAPLPRIFETFFHVCVRIPTSNLNWKPENADHGIRSSEIC